MAASVALLGLALPAAVAAPAVSRLTPPSELFASGRPAPVIARFLPGQRFDLQATLRPDAGRRIVSARFAIDGQPVAAEVALRDCASGCRKGLAPETAVATVRAVTVDQAGLHRFSVEARQDDGATVRAEGNFEIVPFQTPLGGPVKNIILLVGDGMGVAHRTAARIVRGGYAQGKVIEPLAMDSFPATALVKTASLNSVVTDSSPGMTAYVLGNKNDNNEQGVFPDDTLDAFDNPRIEYLSEYLHRTRGLALGIVTTADVFDSTPAGNAVHTSHRGAGTGIVDQFFDDRARTGLTVLMGGGRKWFLPAGTPGSARNERFDYAFSATEPHTAQIVQRWGAAPGAIDSQRDLLADFQRAGWRYAATRSQLDALAPTGHEPLLGLFAFSNMNVALDKIDGRRRQAAGLPATGVVDDFGLPDQPMLDEMAAKALAVLARQPKGFVLMIEGASIDKQAHAMDSERWMLDTLEFDRAVALAQAFARQRGDTLVVVTADHECAGAAVIGASRVSDSRLQALAQAGGKENLRDPVVGVYEQAGFPRYRIAADGYPETTDIDQRLLVGYGANADRHEDWRTNPRPWRDANAVAPGVAARVASGASGAAAGGAASGTAGGAAAGSAGGVGASAASAAAAGSTVLLGYPANALARDAEGRFLVTGQVPGSSAAHTATDIPLSAFGPGALAFTGVIDNTDVFFKLAQAAVRGVVAPASLAGPWPQPAQATPRRRR
ncbi:alkaline phosphatase [Aquabacterium sp. OR-4]|uniref:alkaline phosphatase n=1 Tax=Aquabacterium sp. OR-4 TaxID=2978127 RepID=UPI0021B44228|nr:alkaline phosphatase [Aquabacterium sp. OR-4]MDT7838449.1 alkaline phosphatase [Aquabacterium sp. OR-4]